MSQCRLCSRLRVHTLINQFVAPPRYQRFAIARYASTSPGRGQQRQYSRKDTAVLPTGHTVAAKRKSERGASGPTYGNDPLKLAEEVRGLLRKDKFDDAEEVVRSASKHADQFTVSWNHLIDWQMSQGKVNGAMKTYQDMKKRAQVPDAYTYTIILRGLAEHSHYPQAVQKALTIYHSMGAENSPVDPTIIHTNAALKVCARAGEIDAMFGIAAELRSKGPNAANNLTFTTIFNAIRQNQLKVPSDGMSTEMLQARRDKAIIDARRMWDDIIGRWRKGDIWIDEELVCSMGRILLLGNNRDKDDILSLVEQAMNIPRFIPRLGTEARAMIEPALQGNRPPGDQNETATDPEVELRNQKLTDEFSPVKPPSRSREVSGYARPGSNALSLVLETLNALRSKGSMSHYWQIFTTTHSVLPDSQNFHSYLRNLRVFRASTETVKFLMEMPSDMLERKSFRIALSTCVRDKNNPGAFTNAGKMLDLMQTQLADLDIPALDSYLEVAITSPAIAHSAAADISVKRSESAQGRQILRALERLGPNIINLRSAHAYGEFKDERGRLAIDHQSKLNKDAMVSLFRRTVSAYDMLMNKAMVERSMYGELTARRSKIAAFITRSKGLSGGQHKKSGFGSNVSHGDAHSPARSARSRQIYTDKLEQVSRGKDPDANRSEDDALASHGRDAELHEVKRLWGQDTR